MGTKLDGMTDESTIDYEALAQEAMRGVVRKVLARTAKSGLIGDHHFYISFETEAPGVTLSKRLREKYPREMTIVLQHRFWDLAVTEDRFEVKLTFDGIPERLVIPFSAVKVFFDPSVRFGLQFEDQEAPVGEEAQADEMDAFETLTPRGGAPRQGRTRRPSHLKPATVEQPGEGAEPNGTDTAEPTAPANLANHRADTETDADEASAAEAAAEKPEGGAEIVSLDKFRKK